MHRPLLPVAAVALVLAALTAGMPALGQAGQPDEKAETDRLNAEQKARTEQYDREQAAAQARAREAQQRYEAEVRAVEASRVEYEANVARHNAELERNARDQADYQRRLEAYRAGREGREDLRDSNAAANVPAPGTAAAPATASARTDCQRQNRRNRRAGRVIGGLVGAVAGGVAGDHVGGLVGLPIGALIGDVIARQLNCDEQDQAAAATEQAVEGGVGTTVEWTSETRENVTGSSTVLATERGPDGNECMTVTDIIIVDGEETRAPKRMCRRPPSNRFVRV